MNWHIAAAKVEAGDPDRFAATMIAPVTVRAKLFPLYALNLELAEAAWASDEPLVCLMRLQFWEDALTAFRDGRMMPAHDLTGALAEVLNPGEVEDWLRLIDWRRRESHRLGFATLAELLDFLDGTAGGLMVLAARHLGDPGAHSVLRAVARAGAIAAWLTALPALEARGAAPLPQDGTSAETLARIGLSALAGADQTRVPVPVRPALFPAFAARIILQRALTTPPDKIGSALAPGPLVRTLLLAGTRISGRV